MLAALVVGVTMTVDGRRELEPSAKSGLSICGIAIGESAHTDGLGSELKHSTMFSLIWQRNSAKQIKPTPTRDRRKNSWRTSVAAKIVTASRLSANHTITVARNWGRSRTLVPSSRGRRVTLCSRSRTPERQCSRQRRQKNKNAAFLSRPVAAPRTYPNRKTLNARNE
jgi:hypothetical protein